MQGGTSGALDGAAGGLDEAASIAAARQARQDMVPSMRRLLAGVCALRHISQANLSARIGWSPVKLSQFMTGKKNGRDLLRSSMVSMHKELVVALRRNGLPATEQALKLESSLPQVAAALHAAADASAPPPPLPPPPPTPPPAPPPPLPQPPPPQPPPPPSPQPQPQRQPPPQPPPARPSGSPIYSVNLGDGRVSHLGGTVHIMSIGTAIPSNGAWSFPCPARGSTEEGQQLRLRLGFAGRITFGAGVRGLGGRTIQWEIQRLESPLEFGVHDGPCWVAKELTGTVNDLMALPIIGRAVAKGGNGQHVGRSTPALMWRAVEAKFSAPRQDALMCCGLTHAKVQATLEVANRAADQRPAPTAFGSCSGGLSGLTPGGHNSPVL